MKGLIMKKEEERNIYAVFDDKTIRVYQAYNNEIADETLKLGRFGSKFSLTRMIWIKPSFLWMMNWKTFSKGWIIMEGFRKKEENNIEIQNIGILNNGKIEKSKLFLLEIVNTTKPQWKFKMKFTKIIKKYT